ncbi:MAG: prolipoprotein diacylglyceryl transferase [Candidatus Kuenenia sp.]|nr:prolipoprotein diacylglyceryl transferase [Candidatus Kuenenia hertensis]
MRRILFEVPIPFFHKSIPIYSYGFMLMVAFLVSIAVARWRAKKEGIEPNIITDLGMYLIFAGILGARLFFIIQFYDDYKNNLLGIFKIYEGGLVYYGGLFAAAIMLFVFVKKRKLSVLKVVDIVAPSAALGLAFGRIGCFLNGCCFGKVALNVPWAICFPRTVDKHGIVDGSPAFIHHYQHGLVQLADLHSLPVHPAQLYAFFSNIALFFILNIFFKFRKRDGEILLLFGMIYSVIRFCMESLRGDNQLYFNCFTIAQIISIIVFVVSTGFFIWLRTKNQGITPTIKPM